MSYGTILSLIDSEIELLVTVRNLLSSETVPSEFSKQKRSARPVAEEPAGAAQANADEPAGIPAAAAEPAAAKPRKPRAARTERVSRKRRALPSLPRALGASISATPVAVSAAAVAERREASSREAGAEKESAVVVEGTLDALLRQLQVRETAA